VEDTSALCRTGFFPGLGWLLTRQLWETELSQKWPSEHWDHWMREQEQHKGREAVYPEVCCCCCCLLFAPHSLLFFPISEFTTFTITSCSSSSNLGLLFFFVFVFFYSNVAVAPFFFLER
jgi:hypothetical protein